MRLPNVVLAAALACTVLAPSVWTPVAGAATSGTVSLDPSQKIHPFLQYGASVDRTRTVQVIVQKTSPSVASAAFAALGLGITVGDDFSVIPAFVATMPISSLASVAQIPSVRYISPDGPVQVLPGLKALPSARAAKAAVAKKTKKVNAAYSGNALLTTFPFDTGAVGAWTGLDRPGTQTGSGVTVAEIDSGVDTTNPDLSSQVIAVNVNKQTQSTGDGYGHGTHVAGIINGHDDEQQYLGVAPNSTLVSVKVADDSGRANESDLLRGLDWVYQNAKKYKISALNLSVSTSLPESYATSPVDAAVEHLWNQGVTVVASAGNLGSAQDAAWYAPGNDPLVITVGCLDDNQTTSPVDDSLCPISSRGVTEDGFAKPDLVAPGRKIVSTLATAPNGQSTILATEMPERVTRDGQHMRLSGTSMAAPQVTGAIALLLQRHAGLSPDQLKQILVQSAHPYPGEPDKAGMLDIGAALLASDHPPANKPLVPVPVSGLTPPAGSNTLLWDGTRWGSSYWDGTRWGSSYWDGTRWGSAEWDGTRWGSAYWDGTRWGNAYWDGTRWGGSAWDSDASLD